MRCKNVAYRRKPQVGARDRAEPRTRRQFVAWRRKPQVWGAVKRGSFDILGLSP